MGDMSDSIEWFAAYSDDQDVLECGTDFWSPCCDFSGVYAHFVDGKLIGFQCDNCNKDYDTNYEFEQ